MVSLKSGQQGRIVRRIASRDAGAADRRLRGSNFPLFLMRNRREGWLHHGSSESSRCQGAEEIGMDNKPAQNIQDSFLNTARKERLNTTIYLLSGVKLTGRIRSFDKYSVVLETNNQEQLIFKHAISTVAMGRTIHGHSDKPTVMPSSTPVGEPNPLPSASGTEG